MSLTSNVDPHPLPTSALADKRLPVDAYLRLYKFLTAIRGQRGDYRRNDAGEPVSHLVGMLRFTTDLLEHDAKPVFVFEGGYPDLKAETLGERADRKANAQEKYEQAKADGDEEAMRKWGPRTTRVTDEMVTECKRLLDTLGVPYINAATEADPQCAHLAKQDAFDYVLSADSDVLLHGAPAICRNVKNGSGELFPLAEITESTGLSRMELVKARILQGGDYNDGAHGVGEVYAQRYVKNTPSFEAAMDKAAEKDDSISRQRMREVLEWFQSPDVNEVSVDDMAWREPSAEAISYLVDEKGIDTDTVRPSIRHLLESNQ
jgi:flap endonuclease-1